MIFSPEQIQSRLRIKPFLPLRIIANEGLRYDIRHPDMVWVGEREIHIGLPKTNESTFYDRVIRIPLMHLVGIEDLPETIPASAASSAA